MTHPLYTLLVADAPVEPVLEALRRAGYDPRPGYVSTPETLGVALERQPWDVVIVCHDAAELSVWEALGWLEGRSLRPPLLVVGDRLDEADVVALIGEGVRDVI